MKFALFGSIAALFFASCRNGNTADNSVKEHIPALVTSEAGYTPPADVDARVSASIKSVTDSYLELKNALVAGNSANASKAGQRLMTLLDQVDTAAMTPAQKSSFSNIVPDMRANARDIAGNPGKIDYQRSHFKALSDDTYELARIFGGGRKLFVAYCSMALDGSGANWVSEFPEIRNPYFGDQMLECGEVKEELK